MSLSTADLISLLGAVTALVAALAGVIYQLRMMRREIVDAVSAHKDETIATLRAVSASARETDK